MALKTVSQLKDSCAAILSGIDLGNVDNLNGALERAARVLVQQADIPEASGTQNITLYSGVTDYLCNANVFGTSVTDIRPQGMARPVNDFVNKRFGDDFDRKKSSLPNGSMFTFEYYNGVPIIRIKSTNPIQQVNVDKMNAITGWVSTGSASTAIADIGVYYQQPASLRFTLTGSSSGVLTKALTSQLSIASYEDVGVAFLSIMIPPGATASNLTSISLRIGSDSSNYDTVTKTSGFLGSWVSGEWLLVAFDFAGATSTGTPVWSAIDYVQVTIAHTGTFTNFRVGGLFLAFPSQNQILYESAAIFKAVGATTLNQSITTDTDTIVLNDPAYSIYEYESALAILQQTGGGNGDPTMRMIGEILHGNGSKLGLYAHFRGDNPSQELRMAGNYYDSGPNTYGGTYY